MSEYTHSRRRPGINILMVLRIIGLLLLFESGFIVVPLVTSALYGEKDTIAFAITTGVTLCAGLSMTFLIKPRYSDMGKREGLLLTSLVWVFFSLFGLLPFMIGSPHLGFTDAFFDSISGFTTTGASVLTDISDVGHGILIWRALMQWIGGMGIILFTLAVLPMLNSSGGMQMFNAEVTGITHEKIRPRVSQTAMTLWTCYILLTIVLTLLLWAGPMNLFDSLCHAFSTMSTGGFITNTEGINYWQSNYVKCILILFMFIGGVNFGMIYKMSTGNFKVTWHSEAFRTYVKVVVWATAAVTLIMLLNGKFRTLQSGVIDTLFQVVSTISSTGYTISGLNNWGTPVMLIIFLLMFTGACAGSTSGGSKLDRAIFVAKNIRNEMYRVLHPNAVRSVTFNNRVSSPEIVNKVMVFMTIYVAVIFIGGFILMLFGDSMLDSILTSLACVSNADLGIGIEGFGGSYTSLAAPAKYVMALLMLTGRLELFTVLILFTSAFWKR
ncbi:MAG: TrkH family potassium uptake protein [Muribaculaceae bacterium]|nr:TrkH family potassium uptake protein [Muribaculaceae bacterium]